MINVRELRIGNKIMAYNKIATLYAVSNNYEQPHLRYKVCGDARWHSCFIDDNNIYPIPLTPEILEKCGFKKSITGTCYGIITEDGANRFSIFHDGRFKVDSTDLSVKVKHLHHLQNLHFALIGEELPINL